MRKQHKRQTERDGGASGMKLSHFHSQSVVKLVSLSEQTVLAQRLLPLNSPFHGYEMEEEVLPLRNMKEHFTRQSPSASVPFTPTVKILTRERGSKLLLTLMYQTLCPF